MQIVKLSDSERKLMNPLWADFSPAPSSNMKPAMLSSLYKVKKYKSAPSQNLQWLGADFIQSQRLKSARQNLTSPDGGGFQSGYLAKQRELMQKKKPWKTVWKAVFQGFFFGCPTRIRTQTNRVRVCRATFTQSGNNRSFEVFPQSTSSLYYGTYGLSTLYLKVFSNFFKGFHPPIFGKITIFFPAIPQNISFRNVAIPTGSC